MRFLGRVALLAFVVTSGCAHVKETRTREIIDDQSVRLSEIPRPDLARLGVRATLSGRTLSLTVGAEARCIVTFAERVTTRESVRRVPDATTLAGEATLAALGLVVGIGARRASSGGTVQARDVGGVAALSLGLGAGVALGIDAGRYSHTTTVRTRTLPDGAPRVAPCRRGGPAPRRVELTTPAARRLSAPLDGFGRARLELPDDIWVDDRADFDVRVDGVVVRRLELGRPR